MHSSKFYIPRRLTKLTKAERMFARQSLDRGYRRNTELDVPDFDFIAPASEHTIMSRYVATPGPNARVGKIPANWGADFFAMDPSQITYNFSSAIRKNNFPVKAALPLSPGIMKQYGASGWSFRMLYEFLSDAYNGGVPFIDTYFARVFKTRPVYTRFREIHETIQDDINEERLALFMALPLKADGTPDMRYAASKKFMDFKVWQDPIIRQGCESVAAAIRTDVELCLRTGRLSLQGREGANVSQATAKMRAELGGMIHPNRLFYASGQLIRHLKVYVEVGGIAA
jgi:hypothetical protein